MCKYFSKRKFNSKPENVGEKTNRTPEQLFDGKREKKRAAMVEHCEEMARMQRMQNDFRINIMEGCL